MWSCDTVRETAAASLLVLFPKSGRLYLTAVCEMFGTSTDFICNKKNGLSKILRKADLVIFLYHTCILPLVVPLVLTVTVMGHPERLWVSGTTSPVSCQSLRIRNHVRRKKLQQSKMSSTSRRWCLYSLTAAILTSQLILRGIDTVVYKVWWKKILLSPLSLKFY